jgi:hypothetical protein
MDAASCATLIFRCRNHAATNAQRQAATDGAEIVFFR